ncbi:MAG TPA: HAMP domain-containing sensor histidine kinase [Blastocatellia bacterium]|nr:HAMP domain-containing sensor histidine kinase [Blastocatellia bacterium]
MTATRKKFWSDNRRFRLVLTLELAVMLPAAALIYVHFHHLESIKRDKKVEATIHRDFQYMLSVAEKKINDRIYTMTEAMRDVFPSPDIDSEMDKGKKLELILSENPWMAHAFLFDAEKGFLFRSQRHRMTEQYFREEHDRLSEMIRGWFGSEGKMMCENTRKKSRAITCYGDQARRPGGYCYMTNAFFTFPQLSKDRVVLGGVSFDPDYLKQTFFPELFEELVAQKMAEDRDNQLAMMVYPSEHDGEQADKWLAASTGWGEGKPEVSRNLDDAFRGLALGIKFQGTTVEAIGRRLLQQSFLILGVLSLLMIGGLALTYRSVSKEMSLARLKSDFVSNVSHELRTPLSLIQLYAETLELGRIQSQEKKDEYYRIIRKESERLGRLINNILDFSRIEAGRKEYDMRETDIALLVRNTLDAYRYQIEKNGFEFEMNIESNIPLVRVDREAIARALVNLVNNSLKYSDAEKSLVVRLYRANGVVKLEVVDRGIGIARRDQSKIFEKFYRTCDPLVHNTKGSGLGLSLVRHITHAHGGHVEVESTPGKGSKFTLSLPLPIDTQQPTNGMASGATAS